MSYVVDLTLILDDVFRMAPGNVTKSRPAGLGEACPVFAQRCDSPRCLELYYRGIRNQVFYAAEGSVSWSLGEDHRLDFMISLRKWLPFQTHVSYHWHVDKPVTCQFHSTSSSRPFFGHFDISCTLDILYSFYVVAKKIFPRKYCNHMIFRFCKARV
jgi:hypothetical protein